MAIVTNIFFFKALQSMYTLTVIFWSENIPSGNPSSFHSTAAMGCHGKGSRDQRDRICLAKATKNAPKNRTTLGATLGENVLLQRIIYTYC
jgi:hypothetical protein